MESGFFPCAFSHALHFLSEQVMGTGPASCNSVFVLHLCRLLNQEDLMVPHPLPDDSPPARSADSETAPMGLRSAYQYSISLFSSTCSNISYVLRL